MSDPTADSDARSGAMRQWYEANRETWWQRFWRRNDQADRFMFDLLEEAQRINYTRWESVGFEEYLEAGIELRFAPGQRHTPKETR